MAPGPRLQRLNAALHEEPVASIAYCAFWLLLLCGAAPAMAAIVLPVVSFYNILSWHYDWKGVNKFDPANCKDTELAIVITGCDTGIGKELALWTAKEGFVVFAGCLKKESFGQFDIKEGGSNIKPFILDVTNDKDVEEAAAKVSEWLMEEEGGNNHKRVLHGLINNAGIGRFGKVDWLNISDYQKVMDVNYFGTLRCCKAFLPILKEQSINNKHAGGSRIINVTSVAGLMPPGPGFSAYAASKHAAQTLTESLRGELAVFGINVTSINPSYIQTPMLEGAQSGFSINQTWDAMSPELRQEYGIDYFHSTQDKAKFFVSFYSKVDIVVDQILKTLKVQKSPAQVLIGLDARYFYTIIRMLPAWLLASAPKDRKLIPAVMKRGR